MKVYPADSDQPLTNYQASARAVAANPGVTGVSPFIRSMVLLKTEPDTGTSPIWTALGLVGVDPESVGTVSILPHSIVAGGFDLDDNGLLDRARLRQPDGPGDRQPGGALFRRQPWKKCWPAHGKTNAEVVLAGGFHRARHF